MSESSILSPASNAFTGAGSPRCARVSESYPPERQLPHFRNVWDHVIRRFVSALRFLPGKFSTPNTHGVHPQLVSGADFAHRTVADHKHLFRRQPRVPLDLSKRRFFGQELVAIGIQDAFDERMSLEAQ